MKLLEFAISATVGAAIAYLFELDPLIEIAQTYVTFLLGGMLMFFW